MALVEDSHSHFGGPDDPNIPNGDAPLDIGRVALRAGIAGLIAAIIAVITGASWQGGPAGIIVEPFIVHCALTALGLAGCGYLRNQRSTSQPSSQEEAGFLIKIGFIALAFLPVAVIGVNGYLTFYALRTGGEKLWVAAFMIPAALAFLGFGNRAKENDQLSAKKQSDIVNQSTEGFWRVFIAYLRQTIVIVVFIAMMIAAFFFGSTYAAIIRFALIEDRFIGWDLLIRIFERMDNWDLLEIAAPIIAIALVYPVVGLVAGTWAHFRRGCREDFDRNLSADEVAAIERYAREVELYAETINTSGARWILVAWPFGFLLLIPFTLLFLDGGVGASFFEPIRAPNEGWYIYNDGPGGGEVMAFITLFAAWFLLLAATPLISAKMAVLSFESNAEQNLRGDSSAEMLRRRIAVDIRRGDLNPENDFDAATYLKQIAHKLFSITAKATLGLSVITMICFAADRADFELITDKGIKYRNYLSTDLIDAGYNDITEIDLTCRMTGPDDERSISLHYKFRMQTGDEIYVLSATNPREVRFRIPRRLENWEKTDALARRAGTSAPAKKYTWRDEVDQFEVRVDECQTELSRLLNVDTARRVIALFATDPVGE